MDAAAGHQASDRQIDRQTETESRGGWKRGKEPMPDGPRTEHIDGKIRFGKH